MPKEQPAMEQVKKEKGIPQHKIELEREPLPKEKEGESYDKWIKRIGGPYVDVVENLKINPIHKLSEKEKENESLIISRNGDLVLNNKNIVKIFSEKAKEETDKAGLFNKKTERYRIKKELFGTPEGYYKIIVGVLNNNNRILVDKAFRKGMEKWVEEFEKEKASAVSEEEKIEEEPRKEGVRAEEKVKEEESEKKKEAEEVKEEPEKKEEEKAEEKPEKELSLDEQIEQKKKELEEVERKHGIYYSPVGWFRKKPAVRDLGYYANEAKMRDLKKEIQELKKERRKGGESAIVGEKKEEIKEEIKEPKTSSKEVLEEPTTEEQLKAVEKKLRSVYGKIGARTRRIREGGVLGRADLEKNIAILEKERDRLKETKEKIKERLAIEKRLKEIPKEIKKSTVLEQSKLEEEERKLEKRLKKLLKKLGGKRAVEQVKKNETKEKPQEERSRLKKILEDIAQKAAEITITRDSSLRELWEKGDPESRKKFREKTKELWKEFVVHGAMRFDEKERKLKFLPFTDLDGKVSLGLLKMAGFDINNVKYVPPGEFVPGAINIDTGGKTGIVISKEDKTAWLDHHGEEAGKATIPAERLTYLTLVSLGFLKKNKTLDKLTQFVSRIDRGLYPNQEKLFWKSDRTVLGLQRFFDFERLHDYFKQGRSPEEELSDDDLKKYKLEQRSKEQRRIIENTKQAAEELEKGGFIVDTRFGKVVVDIGRKLRGGYQGARASGYDGYLMFNPQTESFFMSIHNADLTKLGLAQGTPIRKNMWIKPSGEEKLEVFLKDIINNLGGKVLAGSKLDKVIDALELRSKEFVVTPTKSRDKKGNINWLTKELGKMAIFPREFKPQKGKKYTVRIKSDTNPGEKKGVYYLEVL